MTRSTASPTRLPAAAVLAAVLALSLPGVAHATFRGQAGSLVRAYGSVIWVGDQRIAPEAAEWRDPRASADGARVFAVRVPREGAAGGSAGVWTMRIDGTDPVQVTSSAADQSPAPFPDGARIVVADAGALWSVPVRPTDGPGAGRRLLFRDAALQAANPEVSPDGRSVAFDTTDAQGAKAVWTLDVATLQARRRTDAKSDNAEPRWSPDGTRLAFASDRGANREWDVVVQGVAPGSPVQSLTATLAGDARRPVWSPNGLEVAFQRDGVYGMQTIRLKDREVWTYSLPFDSLDWAVRTTVTAPDRLPCTISGKPGMGALQGTPGRDVICGTAGPDRIDGGGGNDVIRAGGGDDVIDGGADA